MGKGEIVRCKRCFPPGTLNVVCVVGEGVTTICDALLNVGQGFVEVCIKTWFHIF